MLKMIDVLKQSFLQNLTPSVSMPSTQLDDQWQQSILATSDHDLKTIILEFFSQKDALETAKALDISSEVIQELKQGLALKAEHLIDTTKIIALFIAIETQAFNQIDVPDCLEDYLI